MRRRMALAHGMRAPARGDGRDPRALRASGVAQPVVARRADQRARFRAVGEHFAAALRRSWSTREVHRHLNFNSMVPQRREWVWGGRREVRAWRGAPQRTHSTAVTPARATERGTAAAVPFHSSCLRARCPWARWVRRSLRYPSKCGLQPPLLGRSTMLLPRQRRTRRLMLGLALGVVAVAATCWAATRTGQQHRGRAHIRRRSPFHRNPLRMSAAAYRWRSAQPFACVRCCRPA